MGSKRYLIYRRWGIIMGILFSFSYGKGQVIPPYSLAKYSVKEMDSFLFKRAETKTRHQTRFSFFHDSTYHYYSEHQYQRGIDSLWTWWGRLYEAGDTTGLDFAVVNNDLGETFLLRAMYTEALPYFKKSSRLGTKNLPQGERVARMGFHKMGIVNSKLGDFYKGGLFIDAGTQRFGSHSGISILGNDLGKNPAEKHDPLFKERIYGGIRAGIRTTEEVMKLGENAERLFKKQLLQYQLLSRATELGFPLLSGNHSKMKEIIQLYKSTCDTTYSYYSGALILALILQDSDPNDAVSILNDFKTSFVSLDENEREFLHGELNHAIQWMYPLVEAICLLQLDKYQQADSIARTCMNYYEKKFDSQTFTYSFQFSRVRAYALQFDKKAGIDSSLAILDHAFELFEDLFLYSISKEEKYYLQDAIKELVDQYIELCGMQARAEIDSRKMGFFLNSALQSLERFRGKLLAFELLQSRKFELLDSGMKYRFAELQNQINLQKATQAANPSKKDSLLPIFQNIKLHEKQFLENIFTLQPTYFKSHEKWKELNLDSIMGTLESDEGVIVFYETETNLFFIEITKANASMRLVNKPNYDFNSGDSDLDCLVEALCKGSAVLRRQQELNQILSQMVWPYYDRPESKRPRKVTIIPHGITSKIPFEALTYPSPKNTDPNYLLYHHEISYSPTMQMFLDAKNEFSNQNKGLAAFFPVFEKIQYGPDSLVAEWDWRNDYDKLGIQEVLEGFSKNLSKRGFSIFKHKDASEEKVKTVSSKVGVLYLASHGQGDLSDPLSSSLYFYPTLEGKQEDGRFHAFEVYKSRFNHDLVVLGGCETGIGKELSGEGMMSMARAFLACGSKAVLMSLWEADEEATVEIHRRFFDHLADGHNKSKALRLAKLDFLAKPRHAHYRHPRFWAAFQLIGSDVPLAPAYKLHIRWWYTWKLYGAIAMVGIVLLLLWRMSKHWNLFPQKRSTLLQQA